MGWANAQTYGSQFLGHEWQATCKHKTESDQLWISPEGLSLLRSVQVIDNFAEHSTVVAHLAVPQHVHQVLKWPLPSTIPWDEIPIEAETTSSAVVIEGETVTERFAHWARHFEEDVHLKLQQQGKQLSSRARGRGQRLQPTLLEETAPILKGSRNGEIAMANDLLGEIMVPASTSIAEPSPLTSGQQANCQRSGISDIFMECHLEGQRL